MNLLRTSRSVLASTGRATTRAAAVTLAAVCGSVILAAPAGAGGDPYSIVAITPTNIRVNTGACIKGPFTVTYTNTPDQEHEWSADIEVWRGPQYVDSRFVYNEGTTTSSAATEDLEGYVYWCSFEGLGTFRLGPSAVEAYNYDTDTDYAFTDDAKATFLVKQDATVGLSAKRSSTRPRQIKLRSRAVYFNDSKSRWVPWINKEVVFQRQTSTGWETVATDPTNSNGVAIAVVRFGRAATFRALVSGTSRTWGDTSPLRSVPGSEHHFVGLQPRP